jgi:hypothetical protein
MNGGGLTWNMKNKNFANWFSYKLYKMLENNKENESYRYNINCLLSQYTKFGHDNYEVDKLASNNNTIQKNTFDALQRFAKYWENNIQNDYKQDIKTILWYNLYWSYWPRMTKALKFLDAVGEGTITVNDSKKCEGTDDLKDLDYTDGNIVMVQNIITQYIKNIAIIKQHNEYARRRQKIDSFLKGQNFGKVEIDKNTDNSTSYTIKKGTIVKLFRNWGTIKDQYKTELYDVKFSLLDDGKTTTKLINFLKAICDGTIKIKQKSKSRSGPRSGSQSQSGSRSGSQSGSATS